jgi:outer membrane autotransporter protein
MQGGLTAEYYFAKQWSALGRVKYFKTGVSFTSDESYGVFEGAVVSIPLDVKWEFTIFKNLRGNLKLGAAYNYELQSDYNFPSEMKTDYSKSFFSMNLGAGISYFVSPKMAFYVDLEAYRLGGYKGHRSTIMGNNYYTDNIHFNLGIKYNFN